MAEKAYIITLDKMPFSAMSHSPREEVEGVSGQYVSYFLAEALLMSIFNICFEIRNKKQIHALGWKSFLSGAMCQLCSAVYLVDIFHILIK